MHVLKKYLKSVAFHPINLRLVGIHKSWSFGWSSWMGVYSILLAHLNSVTVVSHFSTRRGDRGMLSERFSSTEMAWSGSGTEPVRAVEKTGDCCTPAYMWLECCWIMLFVGGVHSSRKGRKIIQLWQILYFHLSGFALKTERESKQQIQ